MRLCGLAVSLPDPSIDPQASQDSGIGEKSIILTATLIKVLSLYVDTDAPIPTINK